MEPIEAAVSGGEIGDTWFGRVTVQHCPICGRRVCEMLRGRGKLVDAWPQKLTCKNSHEFEVVPYRWNKNERKFS